MTTSALPDTFERLESGVRSYCRSFPAVFARAEGARLYDRDGRAWIDFFAGAGTLNYGHNNPLLRDRLVAYLGGRGVVHGLDMATEAKAAFLEALERHVLAPRGLPYRVMFPGPTGTNAVESAIKLARKVTGRTSVVAFTNAFHGMTLGSLALTGNAGKRGGAGVPLEHVTRMPFDGYLGEGVDTLDYLDAALSDPSSGVDPPAAFIVETIQAEGGVNVATAAWLRRLEALARAHDALLVVDDIQVGCGRTGPFFSFERVGLEPDVVVLSKSLSGFGLPLSVALFPAALDVWEPGEHNGTFRGHNLAFVTATAALERYWSDDKLTEEVAAKARLVAQRLGEVADRYELEVRGRGLIQGLVLGRPEHGPAVSRAAWERGLILETCGPRDEVVKLLPPLTVDADTLEAGLDLLEGAVDAVLDRADRSRGEAWPQPADPRPAPSPKAEVAP